MGKSKNFERGEVATLLITGVLVLTGLTSYLFKDSLRQRQITNTSAQTSSNSCIWGDSGIPYPYKFCTPTAQNVGYGTNMKVYLYCDKKNLNADKAGWVEERTGTTCPRYTITSKKNTSCMGNGGAVNRNFECCSGYSESGVCTVKKASSLPTPTQTEYEPYIPPTKTPTPIRTKTPTQRPSNTNTPTPTKSGSCRPGQIKCIGTSRCVDFQDQCAEPTLTPTRKNTPTLTPTAKPKATNTIRPASPTPTVQRTISTNTPTKSPTPTKIKPSPTRTPTSKPNATFTPKPTRTPTATAKPTTATRTPTPSQILAKRAATATKIPLPTFTLIPSATKIPTSTSTPKPTNTPAPSLGPCLVLESPKHQSIANTATLINFNPCSASNTDLYKIVIAEKGTQGKTAHVIVSATVHSVSPLSINAQSAFFIEGKEYEWYVRRCNNKNCDEAKGSSTIQRFYWLKQPLPTFTPSPLPTATLTPIPTNTSTPSPTPEVTKITLTKAPTPIPVGVPKCSDFGLDLYDPQMAHLDQEFCSNGRVVVGFGNAAPPNLVDAKTAITEAGYLYFGKPNIQIRSEIVIGLGKLMNELETTSNCIPFLNSGYRSYEEQEAIFNRLNCEWNEDLQTPVVKGTTSYCGAQRPGFSLHQSGLAVDIYCTRSTEVNGVNNVTMDTILYNSIVNPDVSIAEYGFIHPIPGDPPHYHYFR